MWFSCLPLPDARSNIPDARLIIVKLNINFIHIRPTWQMINYAEV